MDVKLEEQVLSTMLDGERIESLEPHHFTSRERAQLYLAIRSGVHYENLDVEMRKQGWGYEECAYITDVYLVPRIRKGEPLKEAVAELKRLQLMRVFCRAVDEWRKGAPYMEWSKALRTLGEVIRSHGEETSRGLRHTQKPGQTGGALPSPR